MPENQVVLYVVRHGQTILNGEGKFRGTIDVPLDEKGIKDAKQLAKFFENIKIGDAWSSSLDRATHTACIILDPKGLEASPTDELKSLDVGDLAGKLKSEHQAELEYYQEHTNEPFPGGESIQHFRARVRPPILRAIHAGIRNGSPSMIVSHASIVHETGNIIHQDHTSALVKPGGVVAVMYDGKHFTAVPIVKAEKPPTLHYAS